MKRNMSSEMGWGIETEVAWNQQNTVPNSGSWTSAANQDSASSSAPWKALNKSDSTSDPGDDASSSKSGSAITSMNNVTSQLQDGTSNTTLLQTSSSNSWSTSNPTLSGMDSGPWGSSSSPAPSSIGSLGWASNPSSLPLSSNNQGHNKGMQQGSNIIGNSIGSVSLSSGWPTSITGNSLVSTSTLPPSMSSGMQSNTLSSQWQSSSVLGNIGDFSKTSDAGWSNPSSTLIDSNKDFSGSNSDSRMWGISSDKAGDSQWDVKNQWGNVTLAGGDQGASNTEMSFAQATLKGLKIPPVTNTSQPAVNSRQEEILRAIENHEGWGSRPIRQDTSWEIENSPKSLRKFPTDDSAGVTNMCNNSNGTAIWEALRENQSSSWAGAAGVSNTKSWTADKTGEPSWAGPLNPTQDSNSWNIGNNADPKTFGTWGAPGGAGDASNKMWSQKTEVGSWSDSGGVQRTTSIPSWGDDGDAGAWEDQRRLTSNMQAMMPSSSGMGVPANVAGMVPQGIGGVGMTGMGTDVPTWTDGQKPGWNPPASTPTVCRTNLEEPWNKPPPIRSGWGDPANDGVESDNGTSIWTATASKQAKASGWGDTGTQGQWNAAVGAKPKTPAGWDESSWAMAQRAKLQQMPQKFVSSGSNQPTQMRAKLLQHLLDMGFRKEEAQSALITNNLNIEMAINDLKSGNVTMSRKDPDVDMFQTNGPQSRLSYMSKGGLGGEMSDIRPDQVPNFSNTQNTPFPNAHMSNQSYLQSNTNLPPSNLNLNSSSINSSLQQKLVQKMQQQTPPSTTMGQRGPMPPVGNSASSQVPQQQKQQIRAQIHQAVSNGFISPQLLNYQLPHNILVLLHQLLQLQTALQTVVSKQQQLMQQARATGSRSNPQLEQIPGIVSNINQQIINVQKQLQQAQNNLFSTQKPPNVTQSLSGTLTTQSGNNMVDSLDALSTDLANVALQSQSRLTTQWKLNTDASAATTTDNTSTSSAPSMITTKTIDENGENKAPGGKGMFQSSSSPNLNLIPGGLGMTGDKTWSSNMSTTSSSNWPLSADNTSTNSQNDFKMSNPAGTSTSLLLGLPSGLTDVIPEFIPGKPWHGLAKNVEDDPHVTPGSIQLQRSLSVNRVHDESLNHLDGHKLGSSSWSTNLKADNSLGLSQLGNRPPPNMVLSKGAGGQQWTSGSMSRQTSWPHSNNSAFTKVTGPSWSDGSGAPSSWIFLKNLTVDSSIVRALSAQHGNVISFCPLAQGQFALVQYSHRESALVAQQRLNNFQMGSSVIAAEFISEADAQRVISQLPPPHHSTMPPMNASPWSQAPPSTPFQNTGPRVGDPWGTSMPATQLSSKFASGGENHWGLWDRSDYTPNPLSNILGGESM